MKQKTILLLAPLNLPVPATKGGAIEQLITHLIDVNEAEQQLRLIVVAKDDTEAKTYSYQHTKRYYLKDYYSFCEQFPLVKWRYRLYLLWKKLFQNRFTVRIFKKHAERMDSFFYQCALIVKKEKPDYIVNEGGYFLEQFKAMDHFFPRERVYEHLHYNRKEEVELRQYVSNSVSISDFVRRDWTKTPGIRGNNVVLYNGIDIAAFQKKLSPADRTQKRSALGVNETDCLVIFCGRIIPIKGVKELLDAFDRIPNDNIKLLLIGSVAFSENASSDFADKILSQAKSDPRIIPTGFIPNEEMPEYYALSDMQVIPSICQEGAGLVAVEGMAAGLPLIITESGGMPEYTDSSCAVMLPIDDTLPRRLAEEITALAEDEERRKRMGAASKAKASQFTKEQFYHNFVHIFNESECEA